MSADQFAGRAQGFAGWRIQFLLLILLVGISLYIRLRMKESPIIAQLKSASNYSRAG